MITADKRYVDQKAIMIPSPENFRTAVSDSLNFACVAYAAWANWEALQEECSDIGKMYDDNLSGYHDVNKISDDIYIISETFGESTHYIPYVIGKSDGKDMIAYRDYDTAILKALAIKHLGGHSLNTAAMMDATKKLLNMEG